MHSGRSEGTLPAVVAHADWGCDPRKRQVAIATLMPGAAAAGPRYLVESLAAAPDGGEGLFGALTARNLPGAVLVGFDFSIGLPRAYAAATGAESFRDFLGMIGSAPWDQFELAAEQPGEITLHRPFYPQRPGGARREHLYAGLGLSAHELRRRCDGKDAETVFWTLGGKQPGKASLHGWRLLRRASQTGADIALWPFDGSLPALLGGPAHVIVAEAYPREFYRYIGAPPRGRWSKRRRGDRLECVAALLAWASTLDVGWDAGVRQRLIAGFSAGVTGEDEFDAVVGMLGMISVVTGRVPPGVPDDDPAVLSTEGWILGRNPAEAAAIRRSAGYASQAHDDHPEEHGSQLMLSRCGAA
jgi:hypothetical protein